MFLVVRIGLLLVRMLVFHGLARWSTISRWVDISMDGVTQVLHVFAIVVIYRVMKEIKAQEDLVRDQLNGLVQLEL